MQPAPSYRHYKFGFLSAGHVPAANDEVFAQNENKGKKRLELFISFIFPNLF
jgi:hypothetical protein